MDVGRGGRRRGRAAQVWRRSVAITDGGGEEGQRRGVEAEDGEGVGRGRMGCGARGALEDKRHGEGWEIIAGGKLMDFDI